MNKLKKVKNLKFYKKVLDESQCIVFIQDKGIKSFDCFLVRKKLFLSENKILFIKKRIFKNTKQNNYISLSILKGSVAMIYGNNVISLSKDIINFAQKLPINILGGILNKEMIELSTIKDIAQISSKNDIYYQIIESIRSLNSKIILTIRTLITKITILIKNKNKFLTND
jgi:ribosomal protein L10